MRSLPPEFARDGTTICPASGKYSHASQAIAKRHKRHLLGVGGRQQAGRLGIYHCKTCGGWHVGHTQKVRMT